MQDNLYNRIKIDIEKAYYIAKRYKSESSFALLYHKKELSPKELGSLIRMSDHFVQIDENHYFINFTFTSSSEITKAAQNLVFKLDKHFNDTDSCIAIDTFNPSSTAKMVCNNLINILAVIKTYSYSRVEDENVLFCELNNV